MARSVRVLLENWQPNSENRRISAKFVDIESRIISFEHFDYKNEVFINFCLDYFSQKFGKQVMSRARFIYILESGLLTDIVEYTKNGRILGYVLLVNSANVWHYWYSAYDLQYAQQSLGLWMMGDAILQAKELGKKYLYLGTAYGEKGLYKTNFNNIEFWQGGKWDNNIKSLRARCRSDQERTIVMADEWQLSINHF